MTSLAERMYPNVHKGAKKKTMPLTEAPVGHAKVAQQQKPAVKTTKAPQNSAKK